MPITPTYPGVYIEEIPSGVRTIAGVATSITAFVGRAERGPVNKPITINNYGDFERHFGGLWLKSTMSFAVRDFFLNGGSQAIIVRLVNSGETAELLLSNDTLKLVAANAGSWGINLYAQVDYDTKVSNDSQLFNLGIQEKDSEGKVKKFEKFLNVSVDPESARYLPNVLEQESLLVKVGKDDQEQYVIPNTRPDIVPTNNDTAQFQDGADGDLLVQDQYTGAGMETRKEGLYALEKADMFNLLCIPPYSFTSDIDSNLIAQAVAYCQKRRAMFLVDPPSAWKTKEDAKDGFTASSDPYPGITSNYGALFFPRIKQRNPLRDNQMEEFVPCGAVAGIFSRTDTQRGVWKSPAGQEAKLIGVPELSVQLTDDENGELNQLGINCLRAFPIYGRLVWGARTLEGADRLGSEWKYIAVRRTALFIEESLFRGTQWVVFEPNDEPLWAQIRLNVGAFMHNLFRQGAFQGSSPKEAYLVKCDSETTTQNDINMGVVNILVGFAPLKPAEFVFIKIQQLAGKIES